MPPRLLELLKRLRTASSERSGSITAMRRHLGPIVATPSRRIVSSARVHLSAASLMRAMRSHCSAPTAPVSPSPRGMRPGSCGSWASVTTKVAVGEASIMAALSAVVENSSTVVGVTTMSGSPCEVPKQSGCSERTLKH